MTGFHRVRQLQFLSPALYTGTMSDAKLSRALTHAVSSRRSMMVWPVRNR